jgi:hypothetical protein
MLFFFRLKLKIGCENNANESLTVKFVLFSVMLRVYVEFEVWSEE